jgi:hypothetical protein
MSEGGGGFCILPDRLLEQAELDLNEKVLISLIVRRSHKTGKCWESNRGLGHYLGLSADRAGRLVNSLVKRGYLTSIVDRDKGNVRYLTSTEKTMALFQHTPIGESTDRYRRGQRDPIGANADKNRQYEEKQATRSAHVVHVGGKPKGW